MTNGYDKGIVYDRVSESGRVESMKWGQIFGGWFAISAAVALLAVGGMALTPMAAAHALDPLERSSRSPAKSAPIESVQGELLDVVIDDRVVGGSVRYRWLLLDDGSSLTLRGAALDGYSRGDRVQIVGQRNGTTLFATSAVRVPGRKRADDTGATGSSKAEIEGTLQMVHIDDFDAAKAWFEFDVTDASGRTVPLALRIRPAALQTGMKVRVNGRVRVDGSVEPETIVILAHPARAAASRVNEKAAITNNVLVILIRFTDSGAQPFTQAQVQEKFSGGAAFTNVSDYFKETSYGQQMLNATVTPWLVSTSATPPNCDWRTIGTLARSEATLAGYSPSSYQSLVYVFPQISACGWSGLAYVGASGVWSNGSNSLLVYAHELGHNFGLLHAGSLDCGSAPIGGACSASEYGDPFGAMGNQRAMHFNAAQKLDLGWISASSVPAHSSGTATYVLSPLEVPGGSTYAVKVPVASNRTYWLEYRQPIGFDATGLGSFPNSGLQIRVASPFETLCSGCDAYSNDTQFLDMTPGTTAFTDGTLVAGAGFTDPAFGVTFNVLSATSSALSVQVVKAGSAPSTISLASSANPSSSGALVSFVATVTGSSPGGTVAFRVDGSLLPSCAAINLSGSGNSRTATCSTTSLAIGNRSIVASYSGDAANAASTSSTLLQSVVLPPPTGNNVALASNGGVASASSTFGAGYAVAGVNNGERAGAGWGSGSGGWNDATPSAWPDWVQINFNGTKSIDRVIVYTVQDNYGAPVEPTDATTFTQYGLRDFTVQGWNGSGWVTLASVNGNSLVKRTVTFASFTTDRIRVSISSALDRYSRITEIEAWGTTAATPQSANVALAANGGLATASSAHSANYTVASVNNGERAGMGWGSGSGGWNDGTPSAWPDWVQIDFNGFKSVERVVVYTLQDNFGSPVEPSDTMTFTQFGVRDFTVQGWNGSTWVTLARVSGNNLVKRTVTFAAATVDRIRINVTGSLDRYSRITEIEAWGTAVTTPPITNVALAVNGGLASASSTYSASYAADGVNNGERAGAGWGSGNGGWNDATPNQWPDWVQITFDGVKSIDRVVVYTLQDNYGSPAEPTDAMTFTQYGVRDFTVQGWNGASWVTLATVTGNTLVKRAATFTSFSTDRIRVNVSSGLGGHARVTEVEAWGQ
jgi:hypothetical protein